MRGSFLFVFCRHYTKAAESRFHIFTLPASPRDGPILPQFAEFNASGDEGSGDMRILCNVRVKPGLICLPQFL
jgi:hypothetical protein